MTALTDREKELVAIGASIGCNCVPCIAFHVRKAREAGLTDEQIETAVALSEQIRSIPALLVVNTARAHLKGESLNEGQSFSEGGTANCGCEDSIEDSPLKNTDTSKCGC
jgi:4-carboxymuconolactone decarboxylase